MAETLAEVEGVVCSGLGEGAQFTQLDWAVNEFRRKLGFAPHPGTFNLQMQGDSWAGLRERLMRDAGVGITPVDGFCAARCFRVTINESVEGAVVFPEVAGYPPDKFEVIAPIPVRQTLGVNDGDRVTVRVLIE